jgi:hypothetical protein
MGIAYRAHSSNPNTSSPDQSRPITEEEKNGERESARTHTAHIGGWAPQTPGSNCPSICPRLVPRLSMPEELTFHGTLVDMIILTGLL